MTSKLRFDNAPIMEQVSAIDRAQGKVTNAGRILCQDKYMK